jgi:acetylglutamate kinase
MMMSESLSRGMIPKIGACAKALRGGVGRAHLLNGILPHALLLEVYTDAGVGTMLTQSGEAAAPGLSSAFEGGA